MSDSAGSILVVDDEQDLAESCAYFLRRAGYEADTAFSGDLALGRLGERQFDLVITDMRMPRLSGADLLVAIKDRDPDIEVIVITGHPEVEGAVTTMRNGAFDYLTKPFDEAELLDRVGRALTHRELKNRNPAFRDRLRAEGAMSALLYRSAKFRRTIEILERAARTDASVLIQGESGTGKELLAHHLHDSSPRAAGRFVPVDCATMPENLVESELFGHVKGAFSGAHQNKPGLFEVADGGTLFLDEIGELPLPFQSKLLRAIQERQIRRVGGTDTIDIDVRLVCATNRNLAQEVENGAFREDLFYRLDVVRIEVPPLRDRLDDIALLAERFLEDFSERGGPSRWSAEALAAMRAYTWPGNVRQLRNVVERAATLGVDQEVQLEDLPREVTEASGSEVVEAAVAAGESRSGESFQEMKARKVAAIESTYVTELLERHGGNVTRSAEDAGMSRSAFQKLMQRYGIRSVDYRDD